MDLLRRPSQRHIRPAQKHVKEKDPPRFSHQFLWYGTNHTCSIKHEPFPQRKRQDATHVHKNTRKGKLCEGEQPGSETTLPQVVW